LFFLFSIYVFGPLFNAINLSLSLLFVYCIRQYSIKVDTSFDSASRFLSNSAINPLAQSME